MSLAKQACMICVSLRHGLLLDFISPVLSSLLHCMLHCSREGTITAGRAGARQGFNWVHGEEEVH